jgi:hypothetical protein
MFGDAVFEIAIYVILTREQAMNKSSEFRGRGRCFITFC